MAVEILQIIHPWFEHQEYDRVMAATRGTSRFGEGSMAEAFKHFRWIRKQNLTETLSCTILS